MVCTLRRRMMLAAGLVFGVVSLAGMARGEINIVDSLEWMAVDSPVIVEAKVAEVVEANASGGSPYCDVTLKVVRVLKGEVKTEGLTMRVLDLPGKQALEWKKSGAAYLIFLLPGKLGLTEGKWVPRERQGVMDLEHPQGVYLANMKNEKSREEIVKKVETWSQWKVGGGAATQAAGGANMVKAPPEYIRMQIPGDSEIFAQVWAGSACYINVPAEEKYRTAAMALVKDANVDKRQEGAAMLQSYPGPETSTVLRELLEDKGAVEQSDGKRLLAMVYPVRATAYYVLEKLGEKPQKPVMERTPTAAEVKAWEAAREK